jgi:hypothetical protein
MADEIFDEGYNSQPIKGQFDDATDADEMPLNQEEVDEINARFLALRERKKTKE